MTHRTMLVTPLDLAPTRAQRHHLAQTVRGDGHPAYPPQYGDTRPAALIEAQAAYTNALTAMGLTLTDLRHFEWAADLVLLRG